MSGVQTWHLMAVLKQLQCEMEALRKQIDELRDEVRVSGGVEFVFPDGEESESLDSSDTDSEGSVCSARSAPATVSYDREER